MKDEIFTLFTNQQLTLPQLYKHTHTHTLTEARDTEPGGRDADCLLFTASAATRAVSCVSFLPCSSHRAMS